MNIDTGHLVEHIEDVPLGERAYYERIPLDLEDEARAELAGRKETHIQLDRRDSKLAKWAKKRRVDRKRRKARRATVKASRRRNRSR